MRIKKQPPKQPSPEQTATEQHVEAIMNPAVPETPPTSGGVAIDIFKGLPADKQPLNAVTSAPEVPSKSGKSLFSSVDSLQPAAKPTANRISIAVGGTPTVQPITPVANPVAAPAPPPSQPPAVSSVTSPVVVPSEAVEVERLARRDEYSDTATDSAVDEIMAKDGDDLLAAEDAVRLRAPRPNPKKPRRFDGLRKLLTSKKMLILLPLLIIILAAIPFTRYAIAGVLIKQSLQVVVIDSVTTKPVSGATVSFGGVSATTDRKGSASIRVPVGPDKLQIKKGFYKTYDQPVTVSLIGAQPRTISLVATGRQVPITILNTLTNKPVSGVTVKAQGTSAVSDGAGKLTLPLPVDADTVTATLSAKGFNTVTAKIQITENVVPANNLKVTPTGSLYFLSKESGTIDVVKTNLDGSASKVVYAGTGKETAATTSLTASKDWRFVVLSSSRDGKQSALYLIDTTTDKITQFDSSAVTYTPVGWSGHYFVYDVVRSSLDKSQSSRETLKSYNADLQQLNLLDQTQAVGDSTSYGYQQFTNPTIVDGNVVYNTQWSVGGDTAYDLTDKTNSIRTISAQGQSKKDLQTYPAASTSAVAVAHVLPSTIDFALTSSTDSKVTYYRYAGGTVTADASITSDVFTKTYPHYYLSPDGSKTFWNDARAGVQTLLLGDKAAGSPSSYAKAGDYTAYGWYSSQYLLLSRGGDGLYIAPVAGIPSDGAPVRVGAYVQAPLVELYGSR